MATETPGTHDQENALPLAVEPQKTLAQAEGIHLRFVCTVQLARPQSFNGQAYRIPRHSQVCDNGFLLPARPQALNGRAYRIPRHSVSDLRNYFLLPARLS